MEKKVTIELVKKKDCKRSVCFENKDAMAALSSVYVNRSFSAVNAAKKIRVTIEVVE